RERARSEIHLQRIETAGVAVDGVNDLAFIYEDIVELYRACRRAFRWRWHEGADFLWLVRIGNVVCAQAPVEERAEHDLVGLPRRRQRHILVDIMRAESA